jgi:hypothetical protein
MRLPQPGTASLSLCLSTSGALRLPTAGAMRLPVRCTCARVAPPPTRHLNSPSPLALAPPSSRRRLRPDISSACLPDLHHHVLGTTLKGIHPPPSPRLQPGTWSRPGMPLLATAVISPQRAPSLHFLPRSSCFRLRFPPPPHAVHAAWRLRRQAALSISPTRSSSASRRSRSLTAAPPPPSASVAMAVAVALPATPPPPTAPDATPPPPVSTGGCLCARTCTHAHPHPTPHGRLPTWARCHRPRHSMQPPPPSLCSVALAFVPVYTTCTAWAWALPTHRATTPVGWHRRLHLTGSSTTLVPPPQRRHRHCVSGDCIAATVTDSAAPAHRLSSLASRGGWEEGGRGGVAQHHASASSRHRLPR